MRCEIWVVWLPAITELGHSFTSFPLDECQSY
jgi:hypothetical protein